MLPHLLLKVCQGTSASQSTSTSFNFDLILYWLVTLFSDSCFMQMPAVLQTVSSRRYRLVPNQPVRTLYHSSQESVHGGD